MKTARVPALAFLLLAAAAGAQELAITVSPANQEVRQGTAPRFEVQLRAEAPLRLVDLARRPDLRERLAMPRVSGASAATDTPVRFSDAGEVKPVQAGDYLALARGQSLSYEFNGEPYDLAWLPSGRYELRLRLRPDFDRRFVESNAVQFTVIDR